MNNTPAGWYPDPRGLQQSRWWDGQQWTNHTQPFINAPLINSSTNTKNTLGIILFIVAGVLLMFTIFILFAFFSFATTVKSDSVETRTIETTVSPDNGNIFVLVTTCENLCEKYSVRVNLPKETSLYSSDDLNHIVTNIPTALNKIGATEDRVQLCFAVSNDNFTINFSDNDFTHEEKVLTDRLAEIGIPKPEKYGSDTAAGGYSFGNGCMILLLKDIK